MPYIELIFFFQCLLIQVCLRSFKLDGEQLIGKLLSTSKSVKQQLDLNISNYTCLMIPGILIPHALRKIKSIVLKQDFSHTECQVVFSLLSPKETRGDRSTKKKAKLMRSIPLLIRPFPVARWRRKEHTSEGRCYRT